MCVCVCVSTLFPPTLPTPSALLPSPFSLAGFSFNVNFNRARLIDVYRRKKCIRWRLNEFRSLSLPFHGAGRDEKTREGEWIKKGEEKERRREKGSISVILFHRERRLKDESGGAVSMYKRQQALNIRFEYTLRFHLSSPSPLRMREGNFVNDKGKRRRDYARTRKLPIPRLSRSIMFHPPPFSSLHPYVCFHPPRHLYCTKFYFISIINAVFICFI